MIGSSRTMGPGVSARARSACFRGRTDSLRVPGRDRTRHATALGPDHPGGAVEILGELGAAVEHVALDLLHPEGLLEVLPCEFQVEGLAGEDVHAHEVLLGEGVDADV